MASLKTNWQKVPKKTRQTLVLLAGIVLVILSVFVGAVPGPGGIFVFALGVAILGSEFDWADRFGKWALGLVKQFNDFLRSHRLIGLVFGTLVIVWMVYVIVWLVGLGRHN
ncbi:MAG TPA: PGPGW domain-containing protein [Candidatus Saccharimonadales bacterium]|nr:PGPGW domain-containing protein [Candidatus Saccharimonadales bacterium]